MNETEKLALLIGAGEIHDGETAYGVAREMLEALFLNLDAIVVNTTDLVAAEALQRMINRYENRKERLEEVERQS